MGTPKLLSLWDVYLREEWGPGDSTSSKAGRNKDSYFGLEEALFAYFLVLCVPERQGYWIAEFYTNGVL